MEPKVDEALVGWHVGAYELRPDWERRLPPIRLGHSRRVQEYISFPALGITLFSRETGFNRTLIRLFLIAHLTPILRFVDYLLTLLML
jgi:hypothetical protein